MVGVGVCDPLSISCSVPTAIEALMLRLTQLGGLRSNGWFSNWVPARWVVAEVASFVGAIFRLPNLLGFFGERDWASIDFISI